MPNRLGQLVCLGGEHAPGLYKGQTLQNQLDSIDAGILQEILIRREQIEKPRVGDYVLFETGQLERVSHDWDDRFQTSPSGTGSIFLYSNGHGSFSGSLNPAIPSSSMTLLQVLHPGRYWFFHHGIAGAGRGVDFEIPCRVYKTTAGYSGFSGSEILSPHMAHRRTELLLQIKKIEAEVASQSVSA